MAFPEERLRRLRRSPALRGMVRETRCAVEQLIWPLFVTAEKEPRELGSLPGVWHWPLEALPDTVGRALELGVGAVLLFGVPDHKDETGSVACTDEALVPQAVRILKRVFPHLVVITDVCLCAYTTHGHCGILKAGEVDNDASCRQLAAMALAHARAGADMVAPSDMMDGRVGVIRRALDEADLCTTAIMSYSVKCASAYYGPFREAAASAPQHGDRSGYQMDAANRREALREATLDAEEGADILMVKPALSCLDLVRDLRERFLHPLAVYNVSGEYAMVKAASANGWLDERKIVLENLQAMRRAGADLIITYHAVDAARWLRNG